MRRFWLGGFLAIVSNPNVSMSPVLSASPGSWFDDDDDGEKTSYVGRGGVLVLALLSDCLVERWDGEGRR
jgi:hypothetical protein